MADPIAMTVLTDAGVVVKDHAVSVVAPGELGSLGLLRNHAPLVTTLSPGILRWRRSDGTTQRRTIGSGLLEIVKNQLTILTESLSDSTARPNGG